MSAIWNFCFIGTLMLLYFSGCGNVEKKEEEKKDFATGLDTARMIYEEDLSCGENTEVFADEEASAEYCVCLDNYIWENPADESNYNCKEVKQDEVCDGNNDCSESGYCVYRQCINKPQKLDLTHEAFYVLTIICIKQDVIIVDWLSGLFYVEKAESCKGINVGDKAKIEIIDEHDIVLRYFNEDHYEPCLLK